jgi:prepilin-type processing-associated H-X9-DG protein
MDLLKDDSVDHQRVEGAVLISSRSKLSAVKNPHPVERPNLEKAIKVGRSAPAFQMSFEPTPMVRLAAQMGARELIAQSPQIPVEVVELIGSMETMSLAVGLPPRAGAELSIDFPDTESADLAREVVQGQVKELEGRLSRRVMEPGRAAELTQAFVPEARARRVVIELTNEELRQTVGPIMVISMLQSREGGNRVRAGRNLRTLTAAILLWTYEHGEGRLPPDLAAVEQVFDPRAERMTWRMVNTNPRFAQENAFAYVRCADRLDEIKEPDVTVIAYEKPPADGVRDGVNVAFADGRVEWLSAEDFEELSRSQGFEIERLTR